MNLAKIEKVSLREVWKHEALDFTNWLAQQDNIEILSDEIGIDMSVIETESSVGSFSLDILAEEVISGRKIVIENQLEMTNHDHLGKIITYASGLNAEIIIWIVASVRDEHKQAIDWLNEHTDSNINFFAIQMEVWKILDSPYAPKFHVIAKPNDWAKAVKITSHTNELSETKQLQLNFWTSFKEYVINVDSSLRLRKPYPQHWYDINAGFASNAYITLTLNSQSGEMACEVYIPDSKKLFNALYKRKDLIECELSKELEWKELPVKKASRIKLISKADITHQQEWEQYFSWMLNNVMLFKRIFKEHIMDIIMKRDY